MPSRTRPRSDRRESRTEARRRARGASVSGEGSADEPLDDSAPAADRPVQRRTTLLERLLPPAPPLAGKPDPLARFEYRGPRPLRPLAEAAYLLARNPLAWVTFGMAWTVAHLVPLVAPAIAFLSTTLEFGALIVAGVLGWQRPWLYGAAAAFLGSLLFGTFIITLGAAGRIPLPASALDLALGLLSFAVLQALIGALAGWFGGYWRRRFAEASALRRRHQQQRRR